MDTWGKVRGDTAVPGRVAPRVDRESRRDKELPRPVSKALQVDIDRALSLVSGVPCIMTAAFEFKRGGILVSRVMQCADEPPCVMVAVPKGQRLATLIRDGHGFALNALDPAQRLLFKKFGPDAEAGGDPFDMLETRTLPTGAPAITRALAAVDCEVMRHFDLDADHEIYVGQVIAGLVFPKGALLQPAHLNGDAMPGANAAMASPHENGHGNGVANGAAPKAREIVAATPGRTAG